MIKIILQKTRVKIIFSNGWNTTVKGKVIFKKYIYIKADYE